MPRTNNINVELLQVAGPQMTQRIQELFLNIWRTDRQRLRNIYHALIKSSLLYGSET
jgi:hypothetical protein